VLTVEPDSELLAATRVVEDVRELEEEDRDNDERHLAAKRKRPEKES
jgi:hypothetical protein